VWCWRLRPSLSTSEAAPDELCDVEDSDPRSPPVKQLLMSCVMSKTQTATRAQWSSSCWAVADVVGSYWLSSTLRADSFDCSARDWDRIRITWGNPQSGCSDICSYSKRATVGVRASYATRRNSGMKRIKCGWTQPLFRKVSNHRFSGRNLKG
jgi:hypothetical protein